MTPEELRKAREELDRQYSKLLPESVALFLIIMILTALGLIIGIALH